MSTFTWSIARCTCAKPIYDEHCCSCSASAQPALSRPLTSNEFDKAIRAFEKNEGYRLNREQREAVHMALTSALSVICGGAGVGKTTTLAVFLNHEKPPPRLELRYRNSKYFRRGLRSK